MRPKSFGPGEAGVESLDPWRRFHSNSLQSVLKKSPKPGSVVGFVKSHDMIRKLDAGALGQTISEIGALDHACRSLEKLSSRCGRNSVAWILPVSS